ncbi:type IV secretion protein Rhs [Serratia rubidaea]|uniref:Type IV secretion protein Rhs n=2 Tax=Serratia rubidaea TaxID=61652 RepID=A0ABS0M755_SERRU|nr:type IV secretion protein Rhs [Serratia rubidaea]MBH1928077.1 type IV secretion protein Rhs [Serratia rubidaea]MDC6120242.1 type IV secretion protein Rhs [Serratia rubidaea]MEB7583881.1 type IV secretion protein Rhs [Serratia rubidaea]
MEQTTEIREGITRPLTLGEVILARSIFGNSIIYNTVRVHCDSYLPFGLQASHTAMAPNGELWFRKELYKPDFSVSPIISQHTFIHELAHVWQYQHGMWVRSRGLFSWITDYTYRLDGKRRLKDYPMEQQASIIADYFYLKNWGYDMWLKNIGNMIKFRGVSDRYISHKYKYTLSHFFKQR